MNLVERCGKVHDIIRKLMETRDYEAIKLLGEVISGDDINIRKSYMVATKSFREKLGEVRENIVKEYDAELGINKIQAAIIAESQHVLKNYEGKTVTDSLKNIKNDLQDSINSFLSDNEVFQNHFPIKFENGLGKWEINSDGTTNVQPKKGTQHIFCDFVVSKTGIKDKPSIDEAYSEYEEKMSNKQWAFNHRMNIEWFAKVGSSYRYLTKEEFIKRLSNERFYNRWGKGIER